MQKCHQCQEDKKDEDFYKSSICYRCTFKNKTTSKVKEEDELVKKCKICNKEIPKDRLIYWKASYCSFECSKRGKDLHNKNYWIRKCQAPKTPRNFQYGQSKQV